MAIDTAVKRASALGFANPTLKLVVPSGAVTDGDRATMLDLYAGLAGDEPAPETGDGRTSRSLSGALSGNLSRELSEQDA